MNNYNVVLKNINKVVDGISGWLTHNEGELLFNLAKDCTGRGVIVEIGSWMGKSTIYLGRGSKLGNKVKIFAIDPHAGGSIGQVQRRGKISTFDSFKKNIKDGQVDDIVVPIVKTSEEAAKDFKEPIEVLFIDGDHAYDMVKKDFKLWFPKMINGGIIAFHDTDGKPGPTKLASQAVHRSKFFKSIKLVDSITVAQKVQRNKIHDKAMNIYKLIIKNIKIIYPSRFKYYILKKLVKVKKLISN